jgi:hypothetical protein
MGGFHAFPITSEESRLTIGANCRTFKWRNCRDEGIIGEGTVLEVHDA